MASLIPLLTSERQAYMDPVVSKLKTTSITPLDVASFLFCFSGTSSTVSAAAFLFVALLFLDLIFSEKANLGLNWTVQDQIGPERNGQDRRGPDRTREDRTGLDRVGKDWTLQDRTETDRTGLDSTEQDQTGQDRTGPETVKMLEIKVMQTFENGKYFYLWPFQNTLVLVASFSTTSSSVL